MKNALARIITDIRDARTAIEEANNAFTTNWPDEKRYAARAWLYSMRYALPTYPVDLFRLSKHIHPITPPWMKG